MKARTVVTARCLTVAIFACLQAPTFAGIVAYWRFEDGGGYYANDEGGRYRGDLIGFDNYDPGGGDTGYEGWSTNVFAASIPLTGAANTGSIRMQGGGNMWISATAKTCL